MSEELSEKSRLIALLLCMLFGVFGAHRFYAGKYGTGVLMFCSVFLFIGLLWWVIDLANIVGGTFRDKQGRRIFKWFEAGSI